MGYELDRDGVLVDPVMVTAGSHTQRFLTALADVVEANGDRLDLSDSVDGGWDLYAFAKALYESDPAGWVLIARGDPSCDWWPLGALLEADGIVPDWVDGCDYDAALLGTFEHVWRAYVPGVDWRLPVCAVLSVESGRLVDVLRRIAAGKLPLYR
jgi:hypothetical protein